MNRNRQRDTTREYNHNITQHNTNCAQIQHYNTTPKTLVRAVLVSLFPRTAPRPESSSDAAPRGIRAVVAHAGAGQTYNLWD
jgi:hypothetical protein